MPKKKTVKTENKKQTLIKKATQKEYEKALEKAQITKRDVNTYKSVLIVDNIIIAPEQRNKAVIVVSEENTLILTDGDKIPSGYKVLGVINILNPNKII